jgi:predicted molibdopterin-dependent oxidoreductase YjgC
MEGKWGNLTYSSAWNLALMTNSPFIPLSLENNQRGLSEIRRALNIKGKSPDQIIGPAAEGEVKAIYLTGPCPLPKKVKPDFVVVQDSYLNENILKADVVFPAVTFAETEGVFINVEGRVQKVNKVVEPLGESRPDWWILVQLAKKMGSTDLNFKKPSQVMNAAKKEVPGFAGISYPSLAKGKNVFIKEEKTEKKQSLPVSFSAASVDFNKKYPFLLIADYNLDYYKNLILSRDIKSFDLIRNSQSLLINPNDAKKLSLDDGDMVIIESEAGKIKSPVKISDSVAKGRVKRNFIWPEGWEHSTANLGLFEIQGKYPLRYIPVKIKRGK